MLKNSVFVSPHTLTGVLGQVWLDRCTTVFLGAPRHRIGIDRSRAQYHFPAMHQLSRGRLWPLRRQCDSSKHFPPLAGRVRAAVGRATNV